MKLMGLLFLIVQFFILQILYQLYDQEVIREEAILRWDDEKREADESDRIFVRQAETFIKVSAIIYFHFE